MAAFTLALINNHEAGKLFFETYNIPYQVITRGENKGKLRVKVTRSLDGQAVLDARKELEYAGYGFLADHSNVFRDEDDRTVVTFSPYNAVPKVIDVPGYDVEVSDYSIYSYGTKTIVMMTILALQYPDSGKLSTDVPDVDTGIDWLVYLAQYSQQCQAQSRFGVRSRLDIVENTEIMAGPNQSFYCGTL